LFVLAVVYCVVHLGPWPEVRDVVNLIDKVDVRKFSLYAGVLWATALGAGPGLVYLVGTVGHFWAGRKVSIGAATRMAASGLIPLGLSVWMAFAWQMLCVNGTFVLQVLSDPLGWGWNLFGTANVPWRQFWPLLIPFVQVFLVLLGLYYSLKGTAVQWVEATDCHRAALRGALPSWLLLSVLAIVLVKFFAD
jgi:hypothetical protein